MVKVTHRSARTALSSRAQRALWLSAPSRVAAPASGAQTRLRRPAPPAPSTSTGYGGAVSSVDAEASAIGLEVLRKGGNAADAAVATAAALGVTEPYSAGIGGGGYFVYFDAATGEVTTIDGRETAPAAMPTTAFVDPATVQPYAFADAVSSGLSVGRAGHSRHVGGGARPVRHQVAEGDAEAVDRARHPRLPGRRDLRAADGRQPGAVRGVPRHGEAVPAERRAARGRVDLQEPRPGEDPARDRAARHRCVLRGCDRR